MRVWVQGARPRTLVAAVCPVLVGTAAAAAEGPVVAWRALAALVVALALQVGVNYANDYSDGIRGTDDDRVGPLRLTGSGAAAPGRVLAAAFPTAPAAVAELAAADPVVARIAARFPGVGPVLQPDLLTAVVRRLLAGLRLHRAALLRALCLSLRPAGWRGCVVRRLCGAAAVAVHPDNERARRFYAAAGWRRRDRGCRTRSRKCVRSASASRH